MLFPHSQKTPPYTLGVSIKRFKQSSSVLSITRELRRKTEKISLSMPWMPSTKIFLYSMSTCTM